MTSCRCDIHRQLEYHVWDMGLAIFPTITGAAFKLATIFS